MPAFEKENNNSTFSVLGSVVNNNQHSYVKLTYVVA